MVAVVKLTLCLCERQTITTALRRLYQQSGLYIYYNQILLLLTNLQVILN